VGPPPVALEHPQAGRGGLGRRCQGRWHVQSAPGRWTPKGQGARDPRRGAIHRAPHWRPKAQGTAGAGRPPGGNFLYVLAAQGAPTALRP
jgi:hypothetical protein